MLGSHLVPLMATATMEPASVIMAGQERIVTLDLARMIVMDTEHVKRI